MTLLDQPGAITEPGTEEWLRSRLGKLTASRFKDIVGRKKNGDYYEKRQSYMIELIAERLTGMMADKFMYGPMQWGIETEPAALTAYAAKTGEEVTRTGFVDHPRIPMSGCTPDGLVGYDGLVEVKCPESRTHIEYLINRVAPEDYLPQMNWQMACTGRAWVDFASFDPRMPEGLRLFVVRVERDEKQIAAYEQDAMDFLKEMAWMIQRVESGHVTSDEL